MIIYCTIVGRVSSYIPGEPVQATVASLIPIVTVRVHFSFQQTLDSKDDRPIPTESFLRKIIGEYGGCGILDIDIKEYIHLREGLAIVTVESFQDACNLCSSCVDITHQGLTITCTF